MTLDEFMQDLRADVDVFESDWRKNNKKKPKDYPLELPEEDEGAWWEQFMAHRSLTGRM